MTPEEYKQILSSMASEDERVRTVVSLVRILEGYSTVEALAKNFNAIHRMNDESAARRECKTIVKELRKRGVLWRGFYDEFVCPEGFEDVFEEVTSEFVKPPRPLSDFFNECVSKKDIAALKMIELLLKMPYERAGMTQYEMLRTEISEMFSPDVFKSLEERMIRDGVCVYMKKARREMLSLRCDEREKQSVKEALIDFRERHLKDLASTVESRLSAFLNEIKQEMSEIKGSIASSFGIPESSKSLESVLGEFSGFSIDDTMMFLTASFSVMSSVMFIVLTDKLSRYDAYTWHTYPEPTLFISEEMPSWINNIESVFKNAYPPLEERKIAIASPNSKEAYANFESDMLKDLLNRVIGTENIIHFGKKKEKGKN